MATRSSCCCCPSPGALYALPLSPMSARADYTLLKIETAPEETRLSDLMCVSFARGTMITLATGAQVAIETAEARRQGADPRPRAASPASSGPRHFARAWRLCAGGDSGRHAGQYRRSDRQPASPDVPLSAQALSRPADVGAAGAGQASGRRRECLHPRRRRGRIFLPGLRQPRDHLCRRGSGRKPDGERCHRQPPAAGHRRRGQPQLSGPGTGAAFRHRGQPPVSGRGGCRGPVPCTAQPAQPGQPRAIPRAPAPAGSARWRCRCSTGTPPSGLAHRCRQAVRNRR